MKKIIAGNQYLLSWTKNPCTYNENLKDLINNGKVQEINGGYYTVVTAHFSGSFAVVDCTCDEETGDFNPINTSNLKNYNFSK